MVEWNIQSRSHACRVCGASFADRQPYHTLLLDSRENYERIDVCESCWLGQHGPGTVRQAGFVSHWQGTYEVPVARPDPIQKETAESLLRKLIEHHDPAEAAATFILAVMLERKRILKVKDQLHHEGRRIFVYEHARSGDVFTITDPELRLDQLEDVQRDIARILDPGKATEPLTSPAQPETGRANDAVEEATTETPAADRPNA